LIFLTVQRWLSENITMKNEKIIIYSHLSRTRELVSRKRENDVMIKILIKYIIKNYDQEYAETT